MASAPSSTTQAEHQSCDADGFVETGLRLLAVDPHGFDADSLEAGIAVFGQLRGLVTSAESRWFGELSKQTSEHDAEAALRRKQRLSSRTAKRRAKTAKAAAKSKPLRDALANGDISDEHADAMADAEQQHEGAVDDLLDKAKNQGADRFKDSARTWSRQKDGDDGASQAARQFRNRKGSSYIRPDDGMGVTTLELDPVNHAAHVAALCHFIRLRRGLPIPDGGPDEVADRMLMATTSQQAIADAAIALDAAALSGGAFGVSSLAPTARMLTIVDYDVLKQTLSGRLADGTTLAPATVRRLACDAEIIPAVFGSDGVPIDVGRGERLATPIQRALLATRDGGCRGCGVRPEWCYAHHIWHWVDGGPTDLDNLVLLCQSCHTSVHEGGRAIRREADGSFSLFTPPRDHRRQSHRAHEAAMRHAGFDTDASERGRGLVPDDDEASASETQPDDWPCWPRREQTLFCDTGPVSSRPGAPRGPD